jgi:hypothetical protein
MFPPILLTHINAERGRIYRRDIGIIRNRPKQVGGTSVGT